MNTSDTWEAKLEAIFCLLYVFWHTLLSVLNELVYEECTYNGQKHLHCYIDETLFSHVFWEHWKNTNPSCCIHLISCQDFLFQDVKTKRFGIKLLIHPSIIHTAYPIQGCRAWSLSHLSLGKRLGASWTGRQSATGLTHKGKQPGRLMLTGNLGLQTSMSLDCGRKLEKAEKTRYLHN